MRVCGSIVLDEYLYIAALLGGFFFFFLGSLYVQRRLSIVSPSQQLSLAREDGYEICGGGFADLVRAQFKDVVFGR